MHQTKVIYKLLNLQEFVRFYKMMKLRCDTWICRRIILLIFLSFSKLLKLWIDIYTTVCGLRIFKEVYLFYKMAMLRNNKVICTLIILFEVLRSYKILISLGALIS
jgi:hypothetical protein